MVPLAAMFLPLGAWLGRAASWIPVLGTIVRDDRHAQFSTSWPSCWKRKSRCPRPCGLASIALQGTVLARQCHDGRRCRGGRHAVGQGVGHGPLPRQPDGPGRLGTAEDLPGRGLPPAAEAFEARTNSQSALLNMLALPLIYMIIVTFVGSRSRVDDAIDFLDFNLSGGNDAGDGRLGSVS